MFHFNVTQKVSGKILGPKDFTLCLDDFTAFGNGVMVISQLPLPERELMFEGPSPSKTSLLPGTRHICSPFDYRQFSPHREGNCSVYPVGQQPPLPLTKRTSSPMRGLLKRGDR